MKQLSLLQTAFTNIDIKINSRIKEHNDYATKINSVREEFNRISKNLKEVAESYRKHIEEDKRICEALTSKGEFRGDDYVKTFFADIDEQLKPLEEKIKEVVNERSKLPVYELEKRKENL
jgi:predicted metal-dependent peptidase